MRSAVELAPEIPARATDAAVTSDSDSAANVQSSTRRRVGVTFSPELKRLREPTLDGGLRDGAVQALPSSSAGERSPVLAADGARWRERAADQVGGDVTAGAGAGVQKLSVAVAFDGQQPGAAQLAGHGHSVGVRGGGIDGVSDDEDRIRGATVPGSRVGVGAAYRPSGARLIAPQGRQADRPGATHDQALEGDVALRV